MLDQVHKKNLVIGSEVRRQLQARRQEYRVGFFRQFVRGKIDRRYPATAPLQFVGHIGVADSELENTSAGAAGLDCEGLGRRKTKLFAVTSRFTDRTFDRRTGATRTSAL